MNLKKPLLAVSVAALVLSAVLGMNPWQGDFFKSSSESLLDSTPAAAPAKKSAVLCLPENPEKAQGFFNARIDGALKEELNWTNAGTLCEGSPRPRDKGLRLSFTRPGDERRLVIVLGLAHVSESTSGDDLPANLTLILGSTPPGNPSIDKSSAADGGRIFATLGDDKCRVENFRQELMPPARKDLRRYRVSGRGYCLQPARALSGDTTEHGADDGILMSRFDFVGQALYGDGA